MASTTSLVILDPKSSNEYPNQCVSGFIRNIGNVSGNFLLVQTSGKTIKRTLAPLQSYTFTNYYIKSIKNTGTTQLEVELSDSPNTQSNLTIQQLDIGTISGTVNINGNVVISGTVDVNITNATVNVAGTVYVNGIVDVSIQNTTVNVGGSVSISGITDVSITNTTVNVGGNVVVSGTVSINGIVDVSIQNTTVNVNGSVSISGITDVSITNSTININGNVNISSSVQLPTDIGNYTQSLQENQANGTNASVYNPWNFTASVIPTIGNFGSGNNFCSVQENGAKGYLVFYLLMYNPLTTTSSATITVYLYDKLPEGGPSATPINQFSFSSGNMNPETAVWGILQPNINWNYNSLVVIPQQQTGTAGNAIGIAIPNTPNNINSHSWLGYAWNFNDSGFIGYWQTTTASPASLPVAVTNPIQISQGYTESVSSTSSAEVTLFTVPYGKKYKLLNVYFAGTGTDAAVNVYATILRNGEPRNTLSCISFYGHETLYFESVNLPTSSCFSGAAFIGSSTTTPVSVNQTWSTYPEMYPGDQLLILNALSSPLTAAAYIVMPL